MTESVTLYHLPPSFYSQIARIVLEEKGVAWQGRLTAAGPPTYETYAPGYLRLNPGGTVPTLVHDGQPIPDSFEIARYVDRHFPGPALTPTSERQRREMDRWIERLGELPIRELSYGGPRERRVGHVINRRRLANLRRRRRKNPDLGDVYDAKVRDIEGFDQRSLDDAHVDALRRSVSDVLDEADRVLGAAPFLAGERYSLADAMWTVGVARFRMLGLDPLAGHAALADWYTRVKARPSFARADVWERFRPASIARALATKYRRSLLGAAAVTAALLIVLSLYRA